MLNLSREDEIKNMLCSCKDIPNANGYYSELFEIGENLRSDKFLSKLLTFLNALSSKDRLLIFNSLKEKDRCVCELEVILDKSQSSISHHLKVLEEIGIIRGWKKGKFTFYSIENKLTKKIMLMIIEFLDLENNR